MWGEDGQRLIQSCPKQGTCFEYMGSLLTHAVIGCHNETQLYHHRWQLLSRGPYESCQPIWWPYQPYYVILLQLSTVVVWTHPWYQDSTSPWQPPTTPTMAAVLFLFARMESLRLATVVKATTLSPVRPTDSGIWAACIVQVREQYSYSAMVLNKSFWILIKISLKCISESNWWQVNIN